MSRATIFLIFYFLRLTTQRSTPDDDSYVAAVVEYEVRNNVPQNLQNYADLIQDAGNQNADIVVFPELTLSRGRSVVIPFLDSLKEYPVPALRPDLYDEVLVTMSAAARQNAIYVVINIEELTDCTLPSNEHCPESKVYLFNTNVVFDRTGAVIDRYRKINLFGEFTRTPALAPDLGIFSTDFGVTFGHFICFDLMFQVPAVQLVNKHNLTDIVFPTMWFSELPYLTAVQIQEAYAYSMNVNFLGSGANNVNVGSAGSGIFSGKAGSLISIMPGNPTTRLLLAKVPKVPGKITQTYPGPIYDDPVVQDRLRLIADPSLPSHVSQLLSPGFQEIVLRDKDVVCHFKVNISQRSNETSPYFRVFIQDGTNTYARRKLGTAACLFVACKSEDVKSCPYRFGKSEENFEVKELDIKMTTLRKRTNSTLKCNDIEYFPISIRNNKFPLSRRNVSFSELPISNSLLKNDDLEEKSRFEQIIYKITSPQTKLVSFGVWGRIYYRDESRQYKVKKDDIKKYIEIENIIYSYDKKDFRA